MTKSYLITGGTGFLGSALVKRLVKDGYKVRVLDNNSRGNSDRLKEVAGDIEFIEADIRDADAVAHACWGMDSVCHLAYVNGTEFFYSKPELVLEIAVLGMMNVLNGCRKAGVGEFVLASSSEVYQTPPVVPTDETVPLSVPDPLNPRYSYGGGKIISEILAINYGRKYFERVLIFRPHNVYGPDMGWEHVLPQFVLRMKELCQSHKDPISFQIQGTGKETRSFVFIEDFIDGLKLVLDQGQHLNIYHIGTIEEITIEAAARLVSNYFNCKINVIMGELAPGGTSRRCPDIAKLSALGFQPKYTIREGLPILAEWYVRNAHKNPKNNSNY